MSNNPKIKNGENWTQARFNSFITSMLRKGSFRWGPKTEAKRRARHNTKLPNDKGRLVFHSVCAECAIIIPETTSKVDHINPVVDPEIGFEGWDTYIERMFCEVEGFQVLCEDCHDKKTKKERTIGTERKRRERIQT